MTKWQFIEKMNDTLGSKGYINSRSAHLYFSLEQLLWVFYYEDAGIDCSETLANKIQMMSQYGEY